MSIKVSVNERLMHLQRQQNAVLQARQVANLAFAALVQKGDIAPEVALEHLEAIPQLETGKVYAPGELIREGDKLMKFVPGAGKVQAKWESVAEKAVDEMPVIELPVAQK